MRKKKASGQEENESEALQERESWLQLIMENTSDGINIVEYDPRTDKRRLVICNDRYVEMSGRSREELMEVENLNELIHLSDEHRPPPVEKFQKGLPSEGISSWLRPDGKENYYEWVATPLKAGDKYHIIGIDRDVTEQRRVEEALQASEVQYRTTLNSMGDAIHVVDKDLRIVLCNSALVQWRKRLGLESKLVGMTVFEAFPLLPKKVRDEFHHVFQTGEPLISEETTIIGDEEFNTESRKIPILEKGKVVQIVTVVRDITDRKQAEEALRESEKTARALLNATLDSVLLIEPDGTILAVNDIASTRGFRKAASELIGKNVRDTLRSDIVEQRLAQSDKVVRTGKPLRFEDENDGIWLDHNVYPIFDSEGRVDRLAIFATDITERKKAEEALQASEVQYRTTLNSMGDAIHVVDKDLRIVLGNPALEKWCRQLGMESKLVGMTIFEAFPFLSEEVRDEYRHVFQTGETLVREETITIDNKEYSTEARKIPILEKGKVVQIVTVLRDITERKKSEDRLRRLAMIAEQAAEGIGMADLDGVIQFINPSWARMHGYETGEELVGKHISVFHTAEQMKTHVNPFNKEVKRNGRYMSESEQMRKDGTIFPSEMAITLFKDEGGKPVGFLAFVIDITDRKQAEEALLESEYNLRMRVRELDCLYHITEVVNKYHDALDDLLQGIVDILPHACQHPENACARITLGGKKYRTGNFRKSQTKLAADILVAGEKVGVVEIFCLKGNSPVDECSFLEEEGYLIDTIAARLGINIERIQTRQQLLAEQSALEQKNVALREIMTGVQAEKKELGRRIVSNVEKIVMPLLLTLENELPKGQRKYLDLLKESIEDITLPFADSLSKEFTSLTPTEIRICNLIRRGMSTKQIAGLHHISSATVNKHREHIRRKLQITNKDVNLTSYLENYMSSQTEK